MLSAYRTGAPPWSVVREEVRAFEDAVAVVQLFEETEGVLGANGQPINDVLDCLIATERAVAALVAGWMNTGGGGFAYTDFYGPSRAIHLTRGELDAFVARCRARGVELSDVPTPSLPELPQLPEDEG